jgi:hypothetical protein
MHNTNYYIDDMIKTNSAIGMTDKERSKMKLIIDTSPKSEQDCRLCIKDNDPFKNKAIENSTMCYEHIKLCIAYGKYLM